MFNDVQVRVADVFSIKMFRLMLRVNDETRRFQVNRLVQLVRANDHLLFPGTFNKFNRTLSRSTWASIARIFNSEFHEMKTPEQIRVKWKNMRQRARETGQIHHMLPRQIRVAVHNCAIFFCVTFRLLPAHVEQQESPKEVRETLAAIDFAATAASESAIDDDDDDDDDESGDDKILLLSAAERQNELTMASVLSAISCLDDATAAAAAAATISAYEKISAVSAKSTSLEHNRVFVGFAAANDFARCTAAAAAVAAATAAAFCRRRRRIVAGPQTRNRRAQQPWPHESDEKGAIARRRNRLDEARAARSGAREREKIRHRARRSARIYSPP